MLTLLGSILLVLFALLIGWSFVDQRRRNRRLSTQLWLPLTYQTEGMEGLDTSV